jgi:hypothetical protein
MADITFYIPDDEVAPLRANLKRLALAYGVKSASEAFRLMVAHARLEIDKEGQ